MESSFHNQKVSQRRLLDLKKKAHAYTRVFSALGKKNEYTRHESSAFIAGDRKYQQTVLKAVKRFLPVKHVVLVGIGGSSLGTEAVYHALAYKTSPTLTVFDQIDVRALSEFETFIKGVHEAKDIVLVVVSKSGTTTETMMNGTKVLEIFEKKFDADAYAQTIFVGNADTAFMKIGKKKKITCVSIPDVIGGRYSLFTAVGMVPLTLLGIDVISLREGALQALHKNELLHTEASAAMLALQAVEGMHTINFFTFNAPLSYCGMWYRQLLAESIGKRMTTKGTTFSYQILPTVSTSADLHSMAQLYLAGYSGMVTHFVHYDESQVFHVRQQHWMLDHVPFLRGKNFGTVQDAIREGVIQAYDDQKLPYRNTILPKCSAFEIGHLLASLMLEVMYLAYIFDIDAFDQPSVELYKTHTRRMLG